MNIQQLPLELLCMILNGAAPKPDGAGTHLWRARPRRLRPFLEPRWRFAARGVCRLWRKVIEHPSPTEAAAMGDYPHSDRMIVIGGSERVGCPKWPTGRVVCASAVADWIARRPDAWPRSHLDDIHQWCSADATRDQILVAWIASDVPEAVAHALDIICPPRSVLCVGTDAAEPVRESCPYVDDQFWAHAHCNGECVLAQDIARAVLARCSVATTSVVLSRNLHGWPRHLVHLIGHYGRADVAAHLDIDAPQRRDWMAAAGAKDPAYFAHLTDALARSTPEHRAAHAPPTPYCPFQWSTGYACGSVNEHAAARGRWRLFGLCDARGIEFDARVAFGIAARCHRARLMDWLWRRDAAGPRLLPPLLHRAALLAAKDHPYKDREPHPADTIRWLCEVAGYRPDNCQQLAALFDDPLQRTVASLLYLVERWPRMAMDSDAALLRRLFCRCVADGGVAVSRFVRVLDSQCPRADTPDARGWREIDPASLDLWGALSVMCTRCSSLAVASERAEVMLSMMKVCRAVASGRSPCAVDVRGPQRACACTTQADWSHARQAPPGGHADAVQVCADAPERDPAVRAGLALLARWCAPRPTRTTDLFGPTCGHYDGWEQIPPNTAAGRLAGARTRVLAWLASEGLLIDH
ncbi:hypothetical protein pdul_cds_835 [Pandoravirus dulcis]|uniref:F-box incomplete domain containing protein n=1 Tax=Pandoravirus dulcis TaxID=1349409 RepID=S4VYB8_9VIRU|nr:hypothetical protein pdul_cds_835 [Pandoravirus dulcis]AGO83046.1 hypothetical protein pdul_cds_835 [Pandoravirus dulcis]